MLDSPDSSGGHGVERKVLVLGLDGATFDIIEPMVESGRLPVLGRLMREGVWGGLESTIPPVTIPAWVSMTTGMNPGKLGLYDLLRREGYGVEANAHCYEDNTPVWKILNRYGVRTGVMNVPGTYPPDEVDGFMVTGMMTPSKNSPYYYPSTLGADLASTVEDYEIDVPHWKYFDEGIFVKDLYKVTEKRGRAAEYLIGHISCEFYMIVFTSSDRLHHLLWDKRDVVEAYWEELDSIIGRILEQFEDDVTVFVVSDHGFTGLERTFFVNEWLNRKGFLKLRSQFINRSFVKFGRLVEGIYKFLGKLKLIRPITDLLNKVMGLDRISKYTYAYLSNVNLGGRVDWGRTRAFSCVHTPEFGQIYVNMVGKMKEGSVYEEERERVLDSILKKLERLPGARWGEKAHVEAFKAKEVYSGPHLDAAPDIVFTIDGGRCEVDAKVGEGRIFAKGAPLTNWKGTHVREGVFIARGPGIKSGLRVEKATIMDVAPTVLHVYGVPPTQEMDGRVLREIFEDGAVFPSMEPLEDMAEERKKSPALTPLEKTLIEARLKKLGYI